MSENNTAMSTNFESRELFGKTVQVQIPPEDFPTQEQIDAIDATTGAGCQHGWYESCSGEDAGGGAKANLHYRYWLPESGNSIKGVLVYTHGISSECGHASRIDGRPLDVAILVDTFRAKGFAVYARDQYGHGLSEGTRFYIPTWQECRDDLIWFLKLVAGKHTKSIPMFISGESFGGCLTLLVARYFQDRPEEAPPNLDASLLICPAIVGDVPGFPVYQLLRYVLAPLAPTWTPFFMPNTVSGDRIWKDPKVVEVYTDPKKVKMGLDAIGQPFRLGTAVNLLKALEDARGNAIPGFSRPFCIVHGDADVAVPIDGSKLLFEGSDTAAEDKELNVLDDCYHGVLADPKAEEAMEKIVAFVDARMKKFVVPE